MRRSRSTEPSEDTRGLRHPPLGARRSAHILALTFVVLGCDRGCFTRTRDHASELGSVLSGTDCSDGLARCVESRLEVARAAHLPESCGKTGEPTSRACTCPWDVVDRCRNGCALDGTIVLSNDAGIAQLCRPDEVVARPLTAADPSAVTVCAGASLACVDGVVRSCPGAGLPAVPLAICIHGCEAAVAFPEGDAPPVMEGRGVDGATSILCRRTHAEHR